MPTEMVHNLICFQKLGRLEIRVLQLNRIGFALVVKDRVKKRKWRLDTKKKLNKNKQNGQTC